ncbi:MAG: polysaccharide deacetylase family protein [Woeseiaceae bacterium]|nr:polysaccharide deacetylase family protein [Woeseiaceae bacterium]
MKILTFDIEDWFHILDNDSTKTVESWSGRESILQQSVSWILETLESHDQQATFFCLGWVAEEHPDVVRMIHEQGHEIACHSFAHQLVYEMTPDEFKADTTRAIQQLEDLTGEKVTTYRAPGFSITSDCSWAFEVLADSGIEVDCSVFPARRAHGGLHSMDITKPAIGMVSGHSSTLKLFPMNYRKALGRRFIYSGGGYFRLAPEALLKRWFADDDYVMTYFHPRDFEPDQPMVDGLSSVRRFKSYYGINKAGDKLKSLLQEVRFTDVRSADRSTDWQNARRIQLT